MTTPFYVRFRKSAIAYNACLVRSRNRELMIIPSKDLRQPEFPYLLIELPKNPNWDRQFQIPLDGEFVGLPIQIDRG